MSRLDALALAMVILLAAPATNQLRAAAPDSDRTPPVTPVVDFRFAPVWWQTSICLPDDWQKTLVGKEGTLLYDFPGKHSGFQTRIGLSLGDREQWLRQELVSPRVPIVRTLKQVGTVEAVEEAFAVTPPFVAQAANMPEPQVVERLDGGGGIQGWAKPNTACDPFFNDIAVGWNDSIRYRVRAAAGEAYTVVLGLCESWHPEPRKRVLDLKIEGKTRKTVDLVAQPGRHVPALFPFDATDENGDGAIDVEVAAAPGAMDQNTILNVLWVFRGPAPPVYELMTGKSPRQALVHVNCGHEPARRGPPRHNILLVRLTNRGAAEAVVQPVLTIDSEQAIRTDPGGQRVEIGDATTVFSWGAFQPASEAPGKRVLRLAEVRLKPGDERLVVLGVLRGVPSPDRALLYPRGIEHALALRKATAEYWQKADLPYDRLEVPDPGIQALIDGSIRNIYQAREIKRGLPAFQVGPTCYRGLWVVDGSFLMESIAFLGRADEARNGIRYLLSFQRDDGAFMLIHGHWKETGIALWAVTRHARLTGDQAWLAEVWPKLERGWDYIRAMRKEASKDPKALNFGLIPEGFSDGGLGETLPEYTNVYWTLAGMKAAVESARWLGKTAQADQWQREYDDFYATFRRAAERDGRLDAHGNRYVPISMKPQTKVSPQKAQWAFLHAVFPGKVFAHNEPLVLGNLAMLRAVECEGLVRDTGWVAHGVWNYFGSFYAHAWLWQGHGQKAAETLYAFANHASPLLCWREEQMPQGEGSAHCGDMPHNWASAEFIRLVRHLLVLERGDELHLCEGLPAAWIQPGKTIRAKDILTEFGPMALELRTAADGSKVHLALDPPRRNPPGRIVLHLDGWSGGSGRLELPGEGRLEKEIPLQRN